MNTPQGGALLGKYGFDFKKKKDNLTEVFKKLRFLEENEIAKRKVKGGEADFSEDVPSIEHFLNAECKVT